MVDATCVRLFLLMTHATTAPLTTPLRSGHPLKVSIKPLCVYAQQQGYVHVKECWYLCVLGEVKLSDLLSK